MPPQHSLRPAPRRAKGKASLCALHRTAGNPRSRKRRELFWSGEKEALERTLEDARQRKQEQEAARKLEEAQRKEAEAKEHERVLSLNFVKDALKSAENKGIEEGIAKAKEEFNKKSEVAKEA